MEHLKALLIKFVMLTAVLWIVLTVAFGVSLLNTLLVSAVLTAAAYVLGDLLIFRKSGKDQEHQKRNLIATFSDMVLAFAVIWLMGEALFSNDTNILSASLISAILIAGGEWYFHKYIDKNVFYVKESGESITGNADYTS
ncbi:hypothetical protein CYL18_14605 [Pradoshia eiseniae]|uniref:DUF2512 domain-containing protein n=1 Tax=Pradoshia eiseniae TaxID=2064768 RepID=A0A2S7MXE6_9BACI|nr:YndM family protein [Pradoshia eiseniae]PQD94440.1 hypothetical protein CYL18_14605 [Pradoshia eiseniae]